MLASTRSPHVPSPLLAPSSCSYLAVSDGRCPNKRYEQHVRPTGENDEASGANDQPAGREEERRSENDALDALRVRRRGRIPPRSGACEALDTAVICKRYGIAKRKIIIPVFYYRRSTCYYYYPLWKTSIVTPMQESASPSLLFIVSTE